MAYMPIAAKSNSNPQMSASDWDPLAADPDIRRELWEIDQEFSKTHADGLEPSKETDSFPQEPGA
jgi:hypothetical protein